MRHYPPHVPPPSSSLRRRRVLSTLPHVIALLLIASLAAGAAVLSVVAWILPRTIPDISETVFLRPPTQVVDSAMSQLTAYQLSERLVDVYMSDEFVTASSGAVLALEEKIGTAIVVSSDGWALLPLPEKPLTTSTMFGLDRVGQMLAVRRLVPDRTLGVMAVQFEGQSFRVMSFDTRAAIDDASVPLYLRSGSTVYPFAHREISPLRLGERSITEPVFFTFPSATPGDILLRQDGAVAGLVGGDGDILPSKALQFSFERALAVVQAPYRAPSFVGRDIVGYKKDGAVVFNSGFLLSEVPARLRETVKVGDVILKIDDHAYRADDALFRFSGATTTVRLELLRGGEVRYVEVPNPAL